MGLEPSMLPMYASVSDQARGIQDSPMAWRLQVTMTFRVSLTSCRAIPCQKSFRLIFPQLGGESLGVGSISIILLIFDSLIIVKYTYREHTHSHTHRQIAASHSPWCARSAKRWVTSPENTRALPRLHTYTWRFCPQHTAMITQCIS